MAYAGTSIVDYLRSTGEDSSYDARKKLAASKGISGYSGTAAQNTQLLNMLRSATPAPTVASSPAPAASASAAPAMSDAEKADRELARKVISGQVTGDQITAEMNKLRGAPASSAASAAGTTADTSTNFFASARQKINDLLSGLLGRVTNPEPYNPEKDTAYQNYRGELLKEADRQYTDINTDYLGNQSGNFNSAAQQIASSAKNDLINKADLAVGEFEDRYNTNQRNNLSDTMNMVNTLLGIDESEYNRGIDERNFNYQAGQDTAANTGTMDLNAILNTIPANSPLRSIQDYSVALANEKDPWVRAQLLALRYEKTHDPNHPEYQKYADTAELPTYETFASRQSAADQAFNQAQLDLDTKYKNAQIANMEADNARAAAAATKGEEPKSSFSTTQLLNMARDRIAETIPAYGVFDEDGFYNKSQPVLDKDGNPATKPRYTRKDVEEWLSQMLPATPEGDKAFDDIVKALWG